MDPVLLQALADPASYPFAAAAVDLRQTHISAVALVGPFAYKVKKPLDLGFLDFSTLERRRHFCAEEVRLNRRLAPDVYLGVVPVVHTGAGLRVEGDGPVVEWAVKMRRLPDDATLERRVQRGEVGPELLANLARRLAAFHRSARRDVATAAMGTFAVVAGNAHENFAQTRALVGTTVHAEVFARLEQRTESALATLRPRIEARAARGVPCDTHGDLHLDHVYLLPEGLVVVDCIEFNERFRYADPVADMAFLAMDLAFHGRRDLARAFADAYFEASGDAEGRELLPFYTAYRAAVRGKVEGFELAEAEIPEEERRNALRRAQAHWLLALGELEQPDRRPLLVLVGGLPGSGKSTLARGLAARLGFEVIRSDEVRRAFAAEAGAERYSDAWTERTYAECLRRAEERLLAGGRVIVDATFREEDQRLAFLRAAERWGVPGRFLCCQAAPTTVRERLRGRTGDVSEADEAVYEWAARRWEEPGEVVRRTMGEVSTEEAVDEVVMRAIRVLESP